VPNQTPQPMTNTPTCCKENKAGCELTTLSASQLGSALALLLALAAAVNSIMHRTLPDALDKGLYIEYLIFVILTICYFFVGVWLLETQYVDLLRSIASPWHIVEFLVRMLVIVCFVFFPTMAATITRQLSLWLTDPTNPLDQTSDLLQYSLPGYLVLLYAIFLFWDFLVLIGIWRADAASKKTGSKLKCFVVVRDRSKAEEQSSWIRRLLVGGVNRVEHDASKLVWTLFAMDMSGFLLTLVTGYLLLIRSSVAALFPLLLAIILVSVLIWRILPGIAPEPAGGTKSLRAMFR
jgi:hypothetical protein